MLPPKLGGTCKLATLYYFAGLYIKSKLLVRKGIELSDHER